MISMKVFFVAPNERYLIKLIPCAGGDVQHLYGRDPVINKSNSS